MQKTDRLADRLISQEGPEGPRTFRGGAPPKEVLGPTSEGPRPLLGYWNLLIYIPIWHFFECMLVNVIKLLVLKEREQKWSKISQATSQAPKHNILSS